MAASIQATFSFGTDKAKSDLNSLEKDAQSFGQRLKSHFQNIFGFGKGGIDTGQSKRSLTELEQHAGSVSDKIAQHFRRDKFRRAEIALSDFGRTAVTGDVGGAIEGLAGRVTGLGLGIGVAVGVGVGLFKKLTDTIVATKTSYNDLEAELGKPVQGLGIQGLTAQLTASETAIDQFTKQHSGFLNIVKESFGENGVLGGLGAIFTGGHVGSQGETAQELNKAFEQQGKIRKEVAGNEAKLVDIKEKGLKVSQTEADLDKIELESSQKKAGIDKESADRRAKLQKVLKDDEAARSVGRVGLTEDVRHQYEEEIAKIGEVDDARKASVEKEKQLDSETVRQKRDIANATREAHQAESDAAVKGESAGQAKAQQLSDQLSLIDQQLAKSKQLNQSQRADLVEQRQQKRAELFNQAESGFLNPFSLSQDLWRGAGQRQTRRNLRREIQNRLDQDSGLPQVHRDFSSPYGENQEDVGIWKQEEKDIEERRRFFGFTRKQAQEFMQDQPPAGPPSSAESPSGQQQQLIQIPGLEELKGIAEKVGKAVFDAMTLVWGQ